MLVFVNGCFYSSVGHANLVAIRIVQEALLQDRLLGARKKRDRQLETQVAFQAERHVASTVCWAENIVSLHRTCASVQPKQGQDCVPALEASPGLARQHGPPVGFRSTCIPL